MKRKMKRLIFALVLCLMLFAATSLIWLKDNIVGYMVLSIIMLVCFYPQSCRFFDWLVKPDKEIKK